MDVNILEEKEDMISLEVGGESHTFLNLLTNVSWSEGANHAVYFIEHPYLSKPKLVVKSGNPRKVLKDSAQKIIDDCEDFSKKFKRALNK